MKLDQQIKKSESDLEVGCLPFSVSSWSRGLLPRRAPRAVPMHSKRRAGVGAAPEVGVGACLA